MTIIFLKLII